MSSSTASSVATEVTVEPLTADRWDDFVALFGERGVPVAVLAAAAQFARSQGAGVLEAYPVEPKPGKAIPAAFAWTGIPAAFVAAGFTEVARRSPTRPIMRCELAQ